MDYVEQNVILCTACLPNVSNIACAIILYKYHLILLCGIPTNAKTDRSILSENVKCFYDIYLYYTYWLYVCTPVKYSIQC